MRLTHTRRRSLSCRRTPSSRPWTEGDVENAVRFEMAPTTEDVLARRTRASFLNARAAAEIEPHIGVLMRLAKEHMEMKP